MTALLKWAGVTPSSRPFKSRRGPVPPPPSGGRDLFARVAEGRPGARNPVPGGRHRHVLFSHLVRCLYPGDDGAQRPQLLRPPRSDDRRRLLSGGACGGGARRDDGFRHPPGVPGARPLRVPAPRMEAAMGLAGIGTPHAIACAETPSVGRVFARGNPCQQHRDLRWSGEHVCLAWTDDRSLNARGSCHATKNCIRPATWGQELLCAGFPRSDRSGCIQAVSTIGWLYGPKI